MELTFRGATDTAHPQPVIPVYRIHSLTEPFCQKPSCWCQVGKAHVVPLLTAIRAGELALHTASAFAEDCSK